MWKRCSCWVLTPILRLSSSSTAAGDRIACLAFAGAPFWEWIVGEDYVREHGSETPRSLAVVILVNFDEARELHLPKRCGPATIN